MTCTASASALAKSVKSVLSVSSDVFPLALRPLQRLVSGSTPLLQRQPALVMEVTMVGPAEKWSGVMVVVF